MDLKIQRGSQIAGVQTESNLQRPTAGAVAGGRVLLGHCDGQMSRLKALRREAGRIMRSRNPWGAEETTLKEMLGLQFTTLTTEEHCVGF